jgi:hypothetical protein
MSLQGATGNAQLVHHRRQSISTTRAARPAPPTSPSPLPRLDESEDELTLSESEECPEITVGHSNTVPDGGDLDSFKVGFLPWISVLQRVLEVGANDDTCTPQQWIVKALGSERVDLTHAPLLNHLLPELELDCLRLFNIAFDLGVSLADGPLSPVSRSSAAASVGNRAVSITKYTDLTRAQKAQRLKQIMAKLILHFASTRPTIIILHLQTGKACLIVCIWF